MSAPLPVSVIDQADQAACALQPLRLDLLKRLATPGSATTLAKDTGLSRQKINYHLKALLAAGLLEAVEERRKGNCIEQVVQATAKSFVVSPAALGPLGADPSRVQERFSWSYLVAVCARAIRDLGALRRGADESGQQVATLTIDTEICFRSAKERSDFARELTAHMAQMVRKYHATDTEDGRAFRILAAAHPVVPEETT